NTPDPPRKHRTGETDHSRNHPKQLNDMTTTATNKSGLTDEQISQMAIAQIDTELAKLKTELEKADAENYTGTSSEIRQQVAQNTRARYELEQEKRRLQQLRDHIEGPSEGVKSFLNQ